EGVAPLAEGDAPIRDVACGVNLQRRIEPFDRFTELEGMQQRHRAIKRLLRGSVAGGRKVHRTESFAVCRMLMFLRDGAGSSECQRPEHKNKGSQNGHNPPGRYKYLSAPRASGNPRSIISSHQLS